MDRRANYSTIRFWLLMWKRWTPRRWHPPGAHCHHRRVHHRVHHTHHLRWHHTSLQRTCGFGHAPNGPRTIIIGLIPPTLPLGGSPCGNCVENIVHQRSDTNTHFQYSYASMLAPLVVVAPRCQMRGAVQGLPGGVAAPSVEPQSVPPQASGHASPCASQPPC